MALPGNPQGWRVEPRYGYRFLGAMRLMLILILSSGSRFSPREFSPFSLVSLHLSQALLLTLPACFCAEPNHGAPHCGDGHGLRRQSQTHIQIPVLPLVGFGIFQGTLNFPEPQFLLWETRIVGMPTSCAYVVAMSIRRFALNTESVGLVFFFVLLCP